jgi:mannose-6-phosphate isomerase-like protein (cupin superfamily)
MCGENKMNKVYYPDTNDVHEKIWGVEVWLANTELYCGKILILKEGYRCSFHYHKKKDEVFYIYKGHILIEVGKEKFEMKGGSAIRINPGELHRFTGLCDTIIIEISTQHFEEDSYRITESEKVTWWKKYVVDRLRKYKKRK